MPSSVETEQRVSTLVGDRLCAKCGYNLTGQAVLREPHYQMLIVRCPECGTVASVQEYPLLGRWANRWATLLASLWVFVLLGMLTGTGATIFGFSIGIAEEASSEYANFLSQRYQQWQQENNPGAPRRSPNDYKNWRATQDLNALFAEAGGWRNAVSWTALWIGVPFAVTVFAEGCVWAVALLGLRWRARLVVGILVMVVAALFALLVLLAWHNENMTYFWADARQRIGQPLLLWSLLFGGAALYAGMMTGRPLVRWLLRILLPPRLCQSLAFLWIADSLPPPKVR